MAPPGYPQPVRPVPVRIPKPVTALNVRPPVASKPIVGQPANPLGGILSNPLVTQAQMNAQNVLGQANAALRQNRSQALINYGDPGLAQALGEAVDPNTAAAAQANQYSTLANLGYQQDTAHRQLLNNLAARGLLRSGDLGYQQGQQARQYGQARYNAYNDLLGQLNSSLGGYLSTAQNANDQYLQSLLQAFSLYGQNPLGY